jgi:hypothetical protein
MSDIVDAIDDAAMDEAFETPAPEAPVDTTTTDVPAADQPAAPSETVEDALETSDEGDAEKAEPDADTPKNEPEADEPEKPIEAPTTELNWKSAPEQFREAHEKLKKEVLTGNSLKDKFFEGPDKFIEELNGLSTRQFQQTAQEFVKKGIEAMPEEFAEYIASVSPESVAKAAAKANPELLAEALGLDMPLEKARKIIAQVKRQDLEDYLNDNDEETDEKPIAKAEAKTQKADGKLLTEADVEKLVEQRIASAEKPKQVEALRQKTYSEIMKPVESALDAAGLSPKATDTADDKKFKEWATQRIIKDTFEYLIDNEKNSAQSTKAIELIDALDENGVKHLVPILAIKAEDYALEQIAMLTNQKAKARTKPTEKKKDPPKVVTSSGVSAFGNGAAAQTAIKDLTEDDFASVGL